MEVAEALEEEEPSISDIIRSIADGYISELRIADIPDSALSEVDVMEQIAPIGQPRTLQKFNQDAP